MGRATRTPSRAMSSRRPASRGRVGAINEPARNQAVASDAIEPEALVITHWFDSGEDGEPYSATIRLRGQRVGSRGRPKPSDTFTHPGPWRQAILGGWAVDGLLAVALAVGVAGLLAFNLPLGMVLDATAPGLFFAVAIGRVGCFLTGCCAGRCTRSRWGIWSSDRRIGARRIPAQLLESAAGLLIGVVAALLVLSDAPGVDGLIFVAAFGAYILVRQLLLRLRAERREYSWRRNSLVSRGRP